MQGVLQLGVAHSEAALPLWVEDSSRYFLNLISRFEYRLHRVYVCTSCLGMVPTPLPHTRHGDPRGIAFFAAAGSKVEKWMKTPFDILAFGPRVGAGLLLSVPEKLQTL